MMTDHTPGPWHISKFPIHVHDTEIQGPNCQHIASLMRLGFTTRAERDANATLIAAAPDILAVAVAILKSEEREDHTYPLELLELAAAVDKAGGWEESDADHA